METEIKQILTSDGVPLEQSLKKAERRNKIKAFLLVAPLLLFLLITYIFPIGEMLTRSIDDKMVTNMLPKTFKAMENWDGQELPPEEVFASFLDDYKTLVKAKTQGKLDQRLNKEKNGFNSILKKLKRKMKKFEEGKYRTHTTSTINRSEKRKSKEQSFFGALFFDERRKEGGGVGELSHLVTEALALHWLDHDR